MHSLSVGVPGRDLAWRISIAGLATLLLSAGATPGFAAEVRQGESIVVGAGETINDDLYAFGSTVTILGTVNGDVFTAGSNITVSGDVTGDVFAAGGSTTINGPVRQSVRIAGGTVMLSGPIGEDALIAAGNANLAPSASVGRDLLAAAGSVYVSAPVTRNLLASGGEITLAAPVGGDVKARVDTLHLSNGAHIQGSLAYTSPNSADAAPGASVAGSVQRTEPQVRQQPAAPFGAPAFMVIDWIRALVGVSVLGLAVVFLFPRFTQRTVSTGRQSPWASLGLGFALVVGLPTLAVIMLIVGAVLGGWWLALLLLAAYAGALVVGYALAAVFVGRSTVRLLRLSEQHLAWNLLEGLVLFGLVALVPYAGALAILVAVVFGLGALTLTLFDAYRKQPPRIVSPVSQPERVNGTLVTV